MEQTMHRITSNARRVGQALAVVGLVAAAAVLLPVGKGSAETAQMLPAPTLDEAAGKTATETAVFAGGCFWGIQGVFEHVKGVTRAVSGYAGGHVANPGYELVSTGSTGHAESVSVTFDPTQVSYGTLLQIFFSVALDPTQVDRQGPDSGTQYRSALFIGSPEQDKVAHAYVAQLEAAHSFSRPIATQIQPTVPFYPAEAYHQDYLEQHPDAPYIAFNDMPKVRNLQTLFPSHWNSAPTLVGRAAAGKQHPTGKDTI
jgi:peptide-methionine (S)-S-oxide reductase